MKRSMYWLVSGVVALGLAENAVAADAPDFLRGSQVYAPGPAVYANWSGFFVGGEFSYGFANAEFGSRADGMLSSILTGLPLLPGAIGYASVPGLLLPDSKNFTSFGAFAGYDSQWENAVVGIEVNYHYAGFEAAATPSRSFVIPLTGAPPLAYNVDMSKTALISLTDYATVRGRLGWAFGSFLPYATVGLSLGRADITNAARVHYTAVNAGGVVVADVTSAAAETRNDHSPGLQLGRRHRLPADRRDVPARRVRVRGFPRPLQRSQAHHAQFAYRPRLQVLTELPCLRPAVRRVIQ